MKLTAEALIRAAPETVWRKSQDPDEHARWDLRFTDIEYLPRAGPDEPQRFRYATRIGLGKRVEGWGQSFGEPGKQTSALKFGSEDPRSLIVEGTGSWTFKPTEGGLHFSTVYDYQVRYGRIGWIIDRLFFRPLLIWATRWSFDRLRLWIEQGTDPALSFRLWLSKLIGRVVLGIVWIHEGVIPKILFVRPSEIDLVARSGLSWPNPEAVLMTLGIAEIMIGLWLIIGWAERFAALAVSIITIALATLVISIEPMSWYDPFGGISKNLGLLGCAAIVWLLSPVVPHARKVQKR